MNSIFDKIFSFTDHARKKQVFAFLGDDVINIRGFVGHHWFKLLTNLFVPITELAITGYLTVLYFIYATSYFKWLQNEMITGVLKYLSILVIIISIIIILNILKTIYNIYVDYRNDFIVTLTDWIYNFNKDWFFKQSQTKIPYDSIHNITAIQSNIIHTLLNTWNLLIKTIWTLDDIQFIYVNDLKNQVHLLKELHADYLNKNDVGKALKENENSIAKC